MSQRNIYMDHNATTPLHPEVKKVMIEAMESYGNPSSLHAVGRKSFAAIESAREAVAEFIGASAKEIVFVGSGSEANNTVLSMFACFTKPCRYNATGKRGIITTRIEHPCVLETAKCLQERGIDVSFVDVDKHGKVNVDQLFSLINEGTGMVSVMMANNEIGTVQDIKKIAALTHEKGALFHTDAVQAVGKIPVDVKDLGVDFLTLSGHKIYGPKGIGALYVRQGIHYCPLIRGGHQEKGRRAGTENTLGIIGLGKAIEMRKKEIDEEAVRLKQFKKVMREGIAQKIPDACFNGHPEDCLPGTLNISFDGAEGEAVLLYLDLEGIAVSTGSACASGSLDPSHVLLALGISAERAHGAMRISLGRENTLEEVNYVVDKLALIVQRVRGMSSAYEGGK